MRYSILPKVIFLERDVLTIIYLQLTIDLLALLTQTFALVDLISSGDGREISGLIAIA